MRLNNLEHKDAFQSLSQNVVAPTVSVVSFAQGWD